VDRDSGQVLAVYRKDGLSWVAGTPATRYAIRISNQTGGRVLVVLSVDGVNVISGETAEFGQTGYVLDPWRSYDIAGWRKSDTQIAAFEFAALGESYAARTGRPGNVGVVGAAVFLGKPAPSPAALAPPLADARAAAAAPPDALGSAQAARKERLGTAHGQREWSVSTRTQFERLGSSPQALLEIHYDSQANLVAAGVIPGPVVQARAFPGEAARGYVPDPPRPRPCRSKPSPQWPRRPTATRRCCAASWPASVRPSDSCTTATMHAAWTSSAACWPAPTRPPPKTCTRKSGWPWRAMAPASTKARRVS
jgi:hypothetical protein